MDELFPIADLRTLVARALQDADYKPAASARVRDVPDTRTIRYYTTLGLIDRPREMRGRTAFYGAIHVLQIVAIKRLQAEKLTLSDIQQRLTGLPPKKLKALAALPEDFWQLSSQYLCERSAEPQEASADDDFWSRPAATPSAPEPDELPGVSQSIQFSLNPEAQLVVSASGTPKQIDASNLQRLHAAAQPLIKELIRQGLIHS